MTKPFHLMTPDERTALRIAQNQVIAKKIAEQPPVQARTPRKGAKGTEPSQRTAPAPPPGESTSEFTRATPEERALLGGFIRKVNP